MHTQQGMDLLNIIIPKFIHSHVVTEESIVLSNVSDLKLVAECAAAA